MKALALVPLSLGLAAAAPQGSGELVYVAGSGPGARLYVVREDGTATRRLTSANRFESEPAYSPDGKRIAFASLAGTNEDVYVMNADGTGVRRLTNHPAGDSRPSWSPDGKRIVFVSRRTGNFNLFVMNADGLRERRLTSGPRWVANASPSWSPDGRWIAFSSTRLGDGNPELFKLRPDGSRVTRLTFTSTSGELSPDDGFPSWSPDGRSIVFSSTRGGSQHDLWIMRADGKNPRRITRTPSFDDWHAQFSPDGKRIAFTALGRATRDVYVVNADGSGLRRVTAGSTPVWTR